MYLGSGLNTLLVLLSYVFEHKLKKTKVSLKEWVKAPLSNPTTCRKESVDELNEIQMSMENCEISISHLAQEQLAQFKSTKSFRHEEEQLRLKSRSLWLLAGDNNLAYFHRPCINRIS